jgi:C1A family cysteine protease
MKTTLSIILAATVLSIGIFNSIQNKTNLTNDAAIWQKFQSWQSQHLRLYGSPQEQKYRFEVFKNNYLEVKSVNERETSFRFGLNKFSDMTKEEFAAKYLGLNKMPIRATRDYAHLEGEVADEVNWVTKGAVTPIKDQGRCGSCWAFSAVVGLEGAYFLKNNDLKSFSEQQLVDCSTPFGNQGCNGGLMDNAFKYWVQNGATVESQYPYTAVDGNCVYKKEMQVTGVTGFTDVKQDEGQLQQAVAGRPVSIAIFALTIMQYTGGIYSDYASCPAGLLDHGVAAVGYGTDSGKDYWLVKNSWGNSWGEQGYIRFARKSSGPGICGLATAASYPAV